MIIRLDFLTKKVCIENFFYELRIILCKKKFNLFNKNLHKFFCNQIK